MCCVGTHKKTFKIRFTNTCGEGAVGSDIRPNASRTSSSCIPFFVGSAGLSVGHIVQRHVIVHAVGGLLLLQLLLVVRVRRQQVRVRASEVDAVARAERNRGTVAEAIGLLRRIIVNTRDTSSDTGNPMRMRVHGV